MPVSRWRSASALASRSRISPSTSAYFFLPMVRLHTMATRAAPMAPMIAAALPPPGVEHLVGAFEELADAGAMQLQLETADAERAEAEFAVSLLALVHRLDAFEPERRLRVYVGD